MFLKVVGVKWIIPRALNLVKKVGDLKLVSGNKTPTRISGTVRYCLQMMKNTPDGIGPDEVFVRDGGRHNTVNNIQYTDEDSWRATDTKL